MAEMDWNMVYRMEVLCTMPPCDCGQCIRVKSITKPNPVILPGQPESEQGWSGRWLEAGSGDEVTLLEC